MVVGVWPERRYPAPSTRSSLCRSSFFFLHEGARALVSGNAHIGDAGGFVLSWLVAGAILGAIGSVFALFGALASRSVASVLKRDAPRGDGENG